MKQYLKPKYIVLGIAIVVFCFVPILNMSYDVVVQKQVEEEYTTVEPYTVLEEVEEMGRTLVPRVNPSWTESTYTWIPVPRTVTKEVTKYREVTKTRMVERPFIETRTKRVSILRYLLR